MKPIPQPELPGLAENGGFEQLDIAGHELAELEMRLKREGGYRATVQKGRHNPNNGTGPSWNGSGAGEATSEVFLAPDFQKPLRFRNYE